MSQKVQSIFNAGKISHKIACDKALTEFKKYRVKQDKLYEYDFDLLLKEIDKQYFAELNDDVLFGEVWSREDQLDLKTRSIITVTALMSKGILDESLRSHLINAKKNGVSKDELVEVITHVAFYAGWPNAWAVFRMAKEVYENE